MYSRWNGFMVNKMDLSVRHMEFWIETSRRKGMGLLAERDGEEGVVVSLEGVEPLRWVWSF